MAHGDVPLMPLRRQARRVPYHGRGGQQLSPSLPQMLLKHRVHIRFDFV